MVKLFRPAGPEHTATGIVADSHCIPFSSPFAAPAMRSAAGEPLRCKYTKKSGRGTAAAKIKCPAAPNGPTARQSEKGRGSSPAAFRRQAAGNAAGNTADSGRLAARRNGSPADSGHRPARPQRAPPAGGQPRRERHPGPALHAAIRSPGPYPSTLRILTRPARRTRRVGAALQIRRRPVRWSEELSGGYAFAFA